MFLKYVTCQSDKYSIDNKMRHTFAAFTSTSLLNCGFSFHTPLTIHSETESFDICKVDNYYASWSYLSVNLTPNRVQIKHICLKSVAPLKSWINCFQWIGSFSMNIKYLHPNEYTKLHISEITKPETTTINLPLSFQLVDSP